MASLRVKTFCVRLWLSAASSNIQPDITGYADALTSITAAQLVMRQYQVAAAALVGVCLANGGANTVWFVDAHQQNGLLVYQM